MTDRHQKIVQTAAFLFAVGLNATYPGIITPIYM